MFENNYCQKFKTTSYTLTALRNFTFQTSLREIHKKTGKNS